ncbi:unnamed protein product [Amoebophrya sp. A25]|nr:unnamed protein product [Amoebophrya sp. A25]|eukprot:GSA25T00024815001.1
MNEMNSRLQTIEADLRGRSTSEKIVNDLTQKHNRHTAELTQKFNEITAETGREVDKKIQNIIDLYSSQTEEKEKQMYEEIISKLHSYQAGVDDKISKMEQMIIENNKKIEEKTAEIVKTREKMKEELLSELEKQMQTKQDEAKASMSEELGVIRQTSKAEVDEIEMTQRSLNSEITAEVEVIKDNCESKTESAEASVRMEDMISDKSVEMKEFVQQTTSAGISATEEKLRQELEEMKITNIPIGIGRLNSMRLNPLPLPTAQSIDRPKEVSSENFQSKKEAPEISTAMKRNIEKVAKKIKQTDAKLAEIDETANKIGKECQTKVAAAEQDIKKTRGEIESNCQTKKAAETAMNEMNSRLQTIEADLRGRSTSEKIVNDLTQKHNRHTAELTQKFNEITAETGREVDKKIQNIIDLYSSQTEEKEKQMHETILSALHSYQTGVDDKISKMEEAFQSKSDYKMEQMIIENNKKIEEKTAEIVKTREKMKEELLSELEKQMQTKQDEAKASMSEELGVIRQTSKAEVDEIEMTQRSLNSEITAEVEVIKDNCESKTESAEASVRMEDMISDKSVEMKEFVQQTTSAGISATEEKLRQELEEMKITNIPIGIGRLNSMRLNPLPLPTAQSIDRPKEVSSENFQSKKEAPEISTAMKRNIEKVAKKIKQTDAKLAEIDETANKIGKECQTKVAAAEQDIKKTRGEIESNCQTKKAAETAMNEMNSRLQTIEADLRGRSTSEKIVNDLTQKHNRHTAELTQKFNEITAETGREVDKKIQNIIDLYSSQTEEKEKQMHETILSALHSYQTGVDDKISKMEEAFQSKSDYKMEQMIIENNKKIEEKTAEIVKTREKMKEELLSELEKQMQTKQDEAKASMSEELGVIRQTSKAEVDEIEMTQRSLNSEITAEVEVIKDNCESKTESAEASVRMEDMISDKSVEMKEFVQQTTSAGISATEEKLRQELEEMKISVEVTKPLESRNAVSEEKVAEALQPSLAKNSLVGVSSILPQKPPFPLALAKNAPNSAAAEAVEELAHAIMKFVVTIVKHASEVTNMCLKLRGLEVFLTTVSGPSSPGRTNEMWSRMEEKRTEAVNAMKSVLTLQEENEFPFGDIYPDLDDKLDGFFTKFLGFRFRVSRADRLIHMRCSLPVWTIGPTASDVTGIAMSCNIFGGFLAPGSLSPHSLQAGTLTPGVARDIKINTLLENVQSVATYSKCQAVLNALGNEDPYRGTAPSREKATSTTSILLYESKAKVRANDESSSTPPVKPTLPELVESSKKFCEETLLGSIFERSTEISAYPSYNVVACSGLTEKVVQGYEQQLLGN